jgi:acyl carrier protein
MTAPTTTARDVLAQAFIDALELPPDTDCGTLKYRDTPNWDSLAHMQVVVSIESAFDIMLQTTEVLALSSFDAACSILRQHDIAI